MKSCLGRQVHASHDTVAFADVPVEQLWVLKQDAFADVPVNACRVKALSSYGC